MMEDFVMPITACPECGTEIHVEEEFDKGDIIHCEECDEKLEVVGSSSFCKPSL